MESPGTRVRVEFYGIPRHRAGVPHAVVHVARSPATLRDVIESLANQFPQLAEACFRGPALRDGFVANVGGNRFIASPDARLTESESILILSADAGG